MCEISRSAVDMLKANPTKRITNKELFMVFDKIIEDTSKISERVDSLEKRMDEGFAGVSMQINEIKAILEKKNTLYKLFDIKYFWFWLILVTLIMGGLLGVKPDMFHSIISLGG